MASTLARAITPDTVLSFDINPGTLLDLLAARTDKGPRLICFEGNVTLVSPGMPHETASERLGMLLFAVCQELRIKSRSLASTTWKLPPGMGDTAYEADRAYYIHNLEPARRDQAPDLAVEIVVSHSEKKALRAGAFLKIPELWVLDLRKQRLTFYHLAVRGKSKGTYRPSPRSRAFPVLAAAEILERLDGPVTDDVTFHENCREWARRVLVPRLGAGNGDG